MFAMCFTSLLTKMAVNGGNAARVGMEGQCLQRRINYLHLPKEGALAPCRGSPHPLVWPGQYCNEEEPRLGSSWGFLEEQKTEEQLGLSELVCSGQP